MKRLFGNVMKKYWHDYLQIDKTYKDNYNRVIEVYPEVTFHAVKKAV